MIRGATDCVWVVESDILGWGTTLGAPIGLVTKGGTRYGPNCCAWRGGWVGTCWGNCGATTWEGAWVTVWGQEL